MVYPCIVFGLDTAKTQFADNLPYCYDKQYSVTVIDADPDSLIPDKVAMLSKCSFERHFTSDNLNHNLFRLFY
jgi:CO dehydrogenase nickel-insertion accessory protein CooC1